MFLGDFVEQLAANLQNKNIAMPFESEGPWHELFFDLKRTDQEGKPSFLESLRFDWDGPYPKCQELSEFLHALHWNACVDARNPHFDKISLPQGIAALWLSRGDRLDEKTKAFLSSAAARAAELFSNSSPASA